ncbi:MAG: sulfotransferase [Microthrixaceae bacterium]|nr:sulfotransferase [Microthrixaceae bacterium]
MDTYERNGYDETGLRQRRNRLAGLLAERLRIEHAWAEHPEIREVPITAPLYLTGLPRTGTSALLNLLATDPTMRPMALWEGINPSPCPAARPRRAIPATPP